MWKTLPNTASSPSNASNEEAADISYQRMRDVGESAPMKTDDITDGRIVGRPPRHSYVVLDGMRGVAAAAVVTYHANLDFGTSRWLPSAYLAVDLFFVLSGFVIAHAYEHRFASGMTTWGFMRDRLIRFYPLYFLAIVIPPISLFAAKQMGYNVQNTLNSVLSAFLWNIFFLPVPQNPPSTVPLFPLDPPAWSLLFELIVNLAFVVVWRFLTNSRLMLVIAVSAVGVFICTIRFGPVQGGWNSETFAVGLARVFYSFPLGVLLHRMRQDKRFGGAAAALPLIGTGGFLIAPDYWGTFSGLYSLIAVILISPTLVAIGAHVDVRSRAAQQVCTMLGIASYGVYVLHQTLTFLFLRVVQLSLGNGFAAHGNVMTAVFVIVMLLVALILYRVYDWPIRTWLRYRFQRHAKRSLPV